MTYEDLMIDLETLGRTPDGVIVALAAVPFNLLTGDAKPGFYVKIDPDSCVAAGLTICPETVAWWGRQSFEAQAAWASTPDSPARPLQRALELFNEFCRDEMPDEFCPWGNGATFDITLIETALQRVNMIPRWHYRQPRDMRTLIDLAERKMGGKLNVKQPDHTKHKALEDCRYQIAKCSAAARILFR